MKELAKLTSQIATIQKRNARVELDKAWETSWTRKIVVAIVTYIVISLFFWVADLSQPLINAIVPTTGYILSTLTIPLVKNYWIKRRTKS